MTGANGPAESPGVLDRAKGAVKGALPELNVENSTRASVAMLGMGVGSPAGPAGSVIGAAGATLLADVPLTTAEALGEDGVGRNTARAGIKAGAMLAGGAGAVAAAPAVGTAVASGAVMSGLASGYLAGTAVAEGVVRTGSKVSEGWRTAGQSDDGESRDVGRDGSDRSRERATEMRQGRAATNDRGPTREDEFVQAPTDGPDADTIVGQQDPDVSGTDWDPGEREL